jgi:ABC-type nickel/cobalt efflux system permease component RcnA
MYSVNRYLGVQCGGEQRVRVAYWLDFAEVPAWTEIEKLDTDHDSALNPAEVKAYLDDLLPRAIQSWTIEVNGRPQRPRLLSSALDAPPGQGGLSTLRVTAELELRADDNPVTVHLRDTAYADRRGWRQMGAQSSPAGRVLDATVRSDIAPLDYAAGVGREPRVDDAAFSLDCMGQGDAQPAARRRLPDLPVDPRLTQLATVLRTSQGGSAFFGSALALAFALGAGHALAPGHGKVLVGAYLVGSKATARQALALGASFTIIHTASVLLLAAVALALEQRLQSAVISGALELAAGTALIVIALWQIPRRFRALLGRGGEAGHGHLHDEPASAGRPLLRSVMAFGGISGLVPCPGALIVFLTAVAVQRLALGLALIVAFSLGLAATLSGIGLCFVLARGFFQRLPLSGVASRALAFGSSLVVLAMGVVVVLTASAF